MKRLFVALSIGSWVVASAACGSDTNASVVEDAAFVSAITEGDGEALEQSPAGDVDAGAQEDSEDMLATDANMSDVCSMDAIKAQIIEKYDTNNDGILDESERDAIREDFQVSASKRDRLGLRARWAREHRLHRLFWIYDTDGSGSLSEDERAQLRQDLEARCQARMTILLAKFDVNQDGQLDAGEWGAARAALRARIVARRQAVMDEFDTNQNGVLDPLEKAALLQQRKNEIQTQRHAALVKFDTDHSGSLNETEKAALREALRARVRGEFFGNENRI